MRLALQISMPMEPFNGFVREGIAGEKIQEVLEMVQPEVIYFTEQDGYRGAFAIINVNDPSEIPAKAEPFFVVFDAGVRIRIVMTPEDLGRAGLDRLGERLSEIS